MPQGLVRPEVARREARPRSIHGRRAPRAAAVAVAAALALSGCVTGAGVWKGHEVPLPLLLGGVAADLVVTGVIASQVQDFTTGASIGTAFAVTAVDVTVGCFLGACSSLRL
jgi:hypothetical protein